MARTHLREDTMSNNTVLVVGGGFSGITAALEAAEVGYEVYIVEKEP
ncbi:MAG: FAD-dependent oxidoreductase, partial [Thermodesulfobacteriota bacterium]